MGIWRNLIARARGGRVGAVVGARLRPFLFPSPRVRRLLQPVRWGGLRRLQPVSDSWGKARGKPVDRWYIDSFIDSNLRYICGRTFEMSDDRYASRSSKTTVVDVVDIDARNDRATLIADLSEFGSLPTAGFDCAIVTQTLQYVSDLSVALGNIWQSLAPGGVALLSLPAITKFDSLCLDIDRWRISESGMSTLIAGACPGADADVQGYGNVLSAVTLLHGCAVEDVRVDELQHHDPRFTVVVTARIQKPAVQP